MKKTCETCRHCRDFEVLGMEFFPKICKAPHAKKTEFILRFTEVQRRDGLLKSFFYGTCGARGRWWAPINSLPKPARPAPPMPTIKPPKQEWNFPPIDESLL